MQIEKIRLQLQERLDIELREKKVMELILDEFEKMLNDIHGRFSFNIFFFLRGNCSGISLNDLCLFFFFFISGNHERKHEEWDRSRREFSKAKSDMEESFGQLMKKYEEKKILIEQYRKVRPVDLISLLCSLEATVRPICLVCFI